MDPNAPRCVVRNRFDFLGHGFISVSPGCWASTSGLRHVEYGFGTRGGLGEQDPPSCHPGTRVLGTDAFVLAWPPGWVATRHIGKLNSIESVRQYFSIGRWLALVVSTPHEWASARFSLSIPFVDRVRLAPYEVPLLPLASISFSNAAAGQ